MLGRVNAALAAQENAAATLYGRGGGDVGSIRAVNSMLKTKMKPIFIQK